jgi:putative glycosyltransferase
MKLSIVTTLYLSATFIEEFYRRIIQEAKKITTDYEIILVSDGSPDTSLLVAIALHEKDERVRVIELSRNFGQHKATLTGLSHAKGDLIFLLDCDLEEEPELLGRFYQEMQETDADVVYGVQDKRKGGWWERMTGRIFYDVFNILSSHPIPKNELKARLMTRAYVQNLIQHRDREVFLSGLFAITGYRQVPLTVRKLSKGSTTYTFRKKLSMLVDSITSFSNRPLVLIFYLGCFILLVSGAAIVSLIVRKFMYGLLEGWASLIVSVWFLSGLIIFCLGIIGIYLSKIFMETKERPHTVIRNVYERATTR